MNDLTIFQSEQFGTVRTLDEDGKILFCGDDIAKALGYAKPRNAINTHCRYALKRGVGVQTGTKVDGTPAIQNIEMLFITEGDLYRLITHSRLPAAEAFEKWVFDEVLPTIRKTGQYNAKPEPEELPTPNPKQQYLLTGLPSLENEEKLKRSWFNYMLNAISAYYGISSDTILHYAYKEMYKEGIDAGFLKWWYISETGRINASTFEAICNNRAASLELADYLTKQMKRACIKLPQEFFP